MKGRGDVEECETIESVRSGRDGLGGKRKVCVWTKVETVEVNANPQRVKK